MARRSKSRWQRTRELVIKRAGGWCEECGKFRGEHVHHKRYLRKGRGGEPLEWLQLLCLLCHGKKHPKHRFYPGWQQKEVAKKRGKRPGKPPAWKSCNWCGGRFSKEKHDYLCVRAGVDKRGAA